MASISSKQKIFAELFGAFILTFIGAGSVVAAQYYLASYGIVPELLVIALANGIALAVAVTIALEISGGHINPAVTMGFLVTGRIKPKDALAYIIAQVLGAAIAAYALLAFMPIAFVSSGNLGAPSLAQGISVLQGIGIEALITFILVFTVFGVVVGKKDLKTAGLWIGLALTGGILVAGPFTGGAANPARALGPEIAAGFFANWYVYWIGPVIGGIIAALAYEHLVHRK